MKGIVRAIIATWDGNTNGDNSQAPPRVFPPLIILPENRYVITTAKDLNWSSSLSWRSPHAKEMTACLHSQKSTFVLWWGKIELWDGIAFTRRHISSTATSLTKILANERQVT